MAYPDYPAGFIGRKIRRGDTLEPLKKYVSGIVRRQLTAAQESVVIKTRRAIQNAGLLEYTMGWCERTGIPMSDLLRVTQSVEGDANRAIYFKALIGEKALTTKEVAGIMGVTPKYVSQAILELGRDR